MVKFLIATHGWLADGFKSSISVLMGDEVASPIQTINAFVENGVKDPKSAIVNVCNQLKEDDDLILFTDLMFGSVNQFALPFTSKPNIHVVTGINFPVICEVISKLTFGAEEQRVQGEELQAIVEKAREHLLYVGNFESQEVETSNDDFFE